MIASLLRPLALAFAAAPATLAGTWFATASDPASLPVVASEIVELPTIAAPVFRDGGVEGYLLVRAAVELSKVQGPVPPRIVLTDAVLAHVFANPDIAFDDPEGFDRDALHAGLVEAVGSVSEVRNLYLTQIDFLSKGEIRANAPAMRRGGSAGP